MMATIKSTSALLFGLILLASYAFPCSTYKVTANGKTMVGSNYDSWLESPRIWFETNDIGTAFTGARLDGGNGFAPQTGMNSAGLAFVTLATATPENGIVPPGKKQIAGRTLYLKDIMHHCKTVDDVKAYVEQYDHSVLSEDVFLYVDKSGNYLVVEPYTVTMGNDDKYVLANFCPSTIKDFSAIKQMRYVNGTAFLKNKIDSSVPFCTALSDTMHVCRKKLGDGTLLTSILDLNDGVSYLYFYHDYKHQVRFKLEDELAKGNHSIEIASLFPLNAEFKTLTDFKTPLNSEAIDMFLRFCAVLFSISVLVFLFSFIRKRKSEKYNGSKLLLSLLCFLMLFYVFTLARVENIFFFPAPYSDGSISVVSLSSYIPFLILVLAIPLLLLTIKIFRESAWGFFTKWLLAVDNMSFLVLIVLFGYWGLYNIFG